jgi:hypothetical protein
VLVIWEPMYPGDARDRIDARLFQDPRVTSFWDPREISGRWFGDHRLGDLEGIVWDAYYAFAPTARWDALPNQLVATGAPIIGGVDALEHEFASRLTDA